MELSNHSQKSGDNSLNIQTGQLTINAGLSVTHVKEIALDFFESNFYKLSGLARETAEARAREITDKFIQELTKRNPSGMLAAEDPDFQHGLFTIQNEFARCGDRDLEDLLVDLLVDRTKQKERSLLQIVLNEALNVAPKLNTEQLDILSCNFILGHTISHKVKDIDSFFRYIGDNVLVFADSIDSSESNYLHLEYVGCASIRTGHRDVLSIIMKNYQGIFCKGYSKEEIKKITTREPRAISIYVPCLHNNALLQANGINEETIKHQCLTSGLSDEIAHEIIQLNNNFMMDKKEAIAFAESSLPKFRPFIESVGHNSFENLALSSVGIALAHAHSRQIIGFDTELGIWIK